MSGRHGSKDGGEKYIEELIPTYLWQSVVALVLGVFSPFFIAVPFAIVAIVFASKVDSLRVQGRILKAMKASKSAWMWIWVSLALTIVPFGHVLLLNLAQHS